MGVTRQLCYKDNGGDNMSITVDLTPGGNYSSSGTYLFGPNAMATLMKQLPSDDGTVNAYSVDKIKFRVYCPYSWDSSFSFDMAFVQKVGTLYGITRSDGSASGSYVDYEFDLSDAPNNRVYYPNDMVEVQFTSSAYANAGQQARLTLVSGSVECSLTEAQGNFIRYNGNILKSVDYINPVSWSATLKGTFYIPDGDDYAEITLSGDGNIYAPRNAQYYTRVLKALRR